MSDNIGMEFRDLKRVIADYEPGSTLRSSRERSIDLPVSLNIGFFGPVGVGKSALINSMFFATGERWEGRAAEGYADVEAKTISRDPYFVSENIAIIDNRGMKSFHGAYSTEAARQINGASAYGQEVQWNPSFIEDAFNHGDIIKRDCEIHCVVLVFSAKSNINKDTAEHLLPFIEELKRLTGQPPIVVVTHRRTKGVNEHNLSRFKEDLHRKRIDWYYELENYTKDNHKYDTEKHLLLLEILQQCLIIGDKGMQFKEKNRGCTIL